MLASATHIALHVALIAAAAWLCQWILSRFIRGVRIRLAGRLADEEERRRAETLGRVLRYVSGVVIGTIAIILALDALGVSMAPFLGAAGVVGVALGFGAQSLVKDYFSGLLMLLEGQITKGDIVSVAGQAGVVEDLTLRYVQLRDYDGHVHFVPNGQITTVSNLTRHYAYAVIDAGIAYREDIDAAATIMRRTAERMIDDPAYGPCMLDAFEYAGVDRWEDSAVVLRGRFKVRPLEQWTVRREFLKRLKDAFDAAGIEIPYPHVTVYAGAARDGSAAPLQVSGSVHIAGSQP